VNALVQIVIHYGIPLVFLNVLAEQLGLPIPAVPTLIVAGALTRDGRMSSTHVLLAAVVASLISDYLWFWLGRRYGYRILRLLCRISLSPDSCVRDTEANFQKWGMKSLLVAKFIPGFSTVAPPLAGATGARVISFVIYDSLGAAIWAGAAVAVGRAFHQAIDRVIRSLENLGWWAVVFLVSLIALVIFVKWAQRRRFYRWLRMARIQPEELKAMFDRGEAPIVLDARSELLRQRDPRRIPTAIGAEIGKMANALEHVAPHREIVLYCT
jgi:membrane protein DedA with SNARE-associated domain